MARLTLVFAVVFLFGSFSLVAEALRTHESFSTSTYHESNETETEVPLRDVDPVQIPNEDESNTPAGDTTVVPNRFPNGYPGAAHQFNRDTNQYESIDNSGTVLPEGERYPHGYYNENVEHAQDTQTHLPSNSLTGETNPTPAGTIPTDTVHSRYPAGYTYTGVSHTNEQVSDMPPGGRYPNGYYSNSHYTGNSQTTTSNNYNTMNYNSDNVNHPANPSDVDPFTGRSYTTNANVDTDVAPVDRYRDGYVPSQYTQGTFTMPSNSYTSQGSFNTLPYDNTGTVPFEQTGTGCRTAFWVEHVAAWPKFFNVRSTVEEAFGSKAKETFGEMTMLQALLKYGADPFNELVRSGTTAILNSYTRGAYKISHMEVIEGFNTALVSKEAATKQALVFETANVESISAGNACT